MIDNRRFLNDITNGCSHESADGYHIQRPTWWHWTKEPAAPTCVFKDAGVQITLASPKGGRPALDPKSNEFRTDLTRRFETDAAADAQLDKSVRLDSAEQEDFDTVFYPGGHPPRFSGGHVGVCLAVSVNQSSRGA
jgi:hypothetical protein